MKNEPSIQQLFDLSGRVALVTGASGHLGASMANALAEASARVIVGSRTADTGKKAAAALGGSEQGRHLSIVLDHMDEKSINAGWDEAVKLAGKIDILICNGHEPLVADWQTVTAEQFNRQLQNATGYFLLARKMHDQLPRSDLASIIMVGSMYGLVGSYPEVYQDLSPANPVAYQALKGGIAQMARHLAVSWAKDGVRVNCLSPGPFPSRGAKSELVARLEQHSPMARMGEPHELKGAVIFLASKASSYVTGHNLLVDGGWTAW
jgi:NAD(P)-dependent dehydrogenase (short-subunit alcohol dehydrogenase family)